jgi:RNA polymerase sigma factor (TIGR02999 family)
MSDVTRILSAIEQGDPSAAEQLLPLVYDELRKLAARKMAREAPGQTLQATALVHEAYLRLVDVEQAQRWDSRGHFFAAAAEAMRRILIENARRKKSEKHGGAWQRVDLVEGDDLFSAPPDQLLALNDAIERLAREEPEATELIDLCLFAGLSVEEAGRLLGMSRATAYRHWSYARAWLKAEIAERRF